VKGAEKRTRPGDQGPPEDPWSWGNDVLRRYLEWTGRMLAAGRRKLALEREVMGDGEADDGEEIPSWVNIYICIYIGCRKNASTLPWRHSCLPRLYFATPSSLLDQPRLNGQEPPPIGSFLLGFCEAHNSPVATKTTDVICVHRTKLGDPLRDDKGDITSSFDKPPLTSFLLYIPT